VDFPICPMIEEQIGRKLECECQLLNDEKTIRRKELRAMFGVDFGEAGKREVDVVRDFLWERREGGNVRLLP
jgi:hypothetical protein